MRLKIFSFLFILAFALESLYVLSFANAQKNEHKKDRKYINLVVGLDENVKIPYMPRKHRFKGNFKRFTSVTYLRSLKTLRFSPKRAGSATLTIQDARGRIVSEFFLTVRKSDLNKVAKEIQMLLSEIDGISVRIINNKVIVDGQVLLPKELSRIHSVVEQYGKEKASNLVTLSPIAQRKIAEFIERDINNPQIHVRNVNGKFLLEGVADVGSPAENKRERARAEAIAKVYFPDIEVVRGEGKVIKRVASQHVINLIRIPPEEKPPPPQKPQDKLIQIIVHFVELNKDYQKLFRFQWTPDVRDGTKLEFSAKSAGLGGIVSSITGTISNLLPKLNWAKSHGHARVLHSASVIVKDRRAGNIVSETNVPYIGVQGAANGVATGTQFAPIGIRSKITPSVKGSNDNIELNVEFRVRSLQGTTSSGPLIGENNINTTVIVRSRQSAAIGGLVSQTSATGYNKLPQNASNPLISLYASKDFQRQQTQFVVFVTPVIKSSASAGSDRIKRKFRLRN